MKVLKTFFLPGVLAAVYLMSSLTPVAAQEQTATSGNKNPYLKADESWVSISGKVVSAQPDAFVLDYGKGSIKVEMDDWDWYEEGSILKAGDKVTVYGQIDDSLFETTTIEASSVYVENLGTYFYANPADEEYADEYDYWVSYDPIVLGETVVRGTVTSINGREFTIDTGLRKLTVDTDSMAYDPTDETGYQKLGEGDYVSVTGNMDNDFWEKRELKAHSVVTIVDDK